MNDLFGIAFKELLKVGHQEGLKLIRNGAIAAATGAIRSLRYLLLLQYFLMFSCFLAALSAFTSLLLLATQLSETGSLHLTWPLGLCGVLTTLSSLLLGYTAREKTWLQASQIEVLMNQAFSTQKSTSSVGSPSTGSPSAGSTNDAEAIARIVEQVLERKLRDLASSTKSSTPSES